jgi:hypothetical protein
MSATLRRLAGSITFGVSAFLGAVMIAHWSYVRLADRKAKRNRRW